MTQSHDDDWQSADPVGPRYVHVPAQADHLKSLARGRPWSEILGSSRARLEAFRQKLDYTATRDQGIALLNAKYSQIPAKVES